jgi:hypothetical protein
MRTEEKIIRWLKVGMVVVSIVVFAGILNTDHSMRDLPKVAAQSNVTPPPARLLSGVTGSIGGSLLSIGASTTGTATVNGAVTGQPCIASASDGTNMLTLGLIVHCDVTSTNTVTVTLYAIVALTPASKTYNVTIP